MTASARAHALWIPMAATSWSVERFPERLADDHPITIERNAAIFQDGEVITAFRHFHPFGEWTSSMPAGSLLRPPCSRGRAGREARCGTDRSFRRRRGTPGARRLHSARGG